MTAPDSTSVEVEVRGTCVEVLGSGAVAADFELAGAASELSADRASVLKVAVVVVEVVMAVGAAVVLLVEGS